MDLVQLVLLVIVIGYVAELIINNRRQQVEQDKIRILNEKCLELEERITFLEATIYKFRLTLEPGKVKADDIEEFCDLVDDYFNSMEAIKGGNAIGLA